MRRPCPYLALSRGGTTAASQSPLRGAPSAERDHRDTLADRDEVLPGAVTVGIEAPDIASQVWLNRVMSGTA